MLVLELVLVLVLESRVPVGFVPGFRFLRFGGGIELRGGGVFFFPAFSFGGGMELRGGGAAFMLFVFFADDAAIAATMSTKAVGQIPV